VRVELAKEILDAARARLGIEGPAGLSLRAVARDLGLVPSALYRYYESRDALLTALIIDAYGGLGEAAASADAAVGSADFAARWKDTTRAIRSWGLEHPQEWALIYGSPVPGYRAPTDTVAAASTVTVAVGRILGDAYRAGRLVPPVDLVVPEDLAADADRMRSLLVGDAPDEVVVVAVVALGYLLGAVSLELFGQYNNAIFARDAMWDAATGVMAGAVGLDLSGGAQR
jgi:AcrR family transcriptional regulator